MNHFYDDAVAAVAAISFANDDIPSKRRPPMSASGGGHVFSLLISLSLSLSLSLSRSSGFPLFFLGRQEEDRTRSGRDE